MILARRIKLRTNFSANLELTVKKLSSRSSLNFEDEKVKDSSKVIGLTLNQQKNILKRRPVYDENMRLLKVAIIGAPNAGKSTLANKLINWKFSSVSQKVHTTRHRTLGVLTESNKQVIFLDTPGVIVPSKVKKHNLEMSLLVDPHQALHEADLILVVVDVSNLWHRTHLEEEIMKMLVYHANKPSLLVLNKVDLLKSKEEVLNVIRILTEGCLNGRKYYQSGQGKQKNLAKDSDANFLENLFKRMKEEMEKENEKNGNSHSRTEIDVNIATTTTTDDDDDGGESSSSSVSSSSSTSSSPSVASSLLSSSPSSSSSSSSTSSTPSLASSSSSSSSSLSLPPASQSSSVLPNLKRQLVSVDRGSVNLREQVQWLAYYSKLNEIGREMRHCYGWPYFKEVFVISAASGDGIYELKNYLVDLSIPSKWLFHEQVVTNQNPLQLARDIVLEKLLDNLAEEIPYQIEIKLVTWHVDDEDLLRAQFELSCSKKRHIHKLLGKNGETIRKISMEVKQELMNAFKREMSLQLIVRGNSKTKPPIKK
ncbi:hypothetical protein HELRODRAFT_95909 [Helobdella robusta]|uniref:GTPase Era, mitochondrial n=1 Tax=Helobdella robusta TaxID=6412 RepID=T1G988_HELRO|nr:hypothetical protein HELRODRAFT_95909 [Helobdella robusta]ESN92608.1 hypothetical protein HELRODRAFT_95909 [Helobdella robusta]